MERDRRWSGDRFRVVRRSAEMRREGEGAALARGTVHGDGSTHEGHQPGGNGQAQASAAILAGGGGVLLLEGPEDTLLLVGRNADAGVAHREAEADFLRPRRRQRAVVLIYFHAHYHLAVLGEFDGVPRRVGGPFRSPAG